MKTHRSILCAFVALLLVWILEAPRLTAQVHDRSDAVFSIVMPRAAARSVDMGRITAGTIRDSLVAPFLDNTGPARIRIDSLYIEGTDAAVFTATGGLPPVHLPVQGTHDVAFSFAPLSAGSFQATIVLHTQVDTQRYAIRGEAVAPQIAVEASRVDFGAVPVGGRRDTTVAVMLRNLTAGPVRVHDIRQQGPDDTQFSVLTGGAPVLLPPFGSHAMTLRFAPRRAGRSSGSLAFFADGVPDAAVAQLFGEGIGVTAEAVLSTDTLRAAAGNIVRVPLRLRADARLALAGASAVTTQLRYRASLLVPIGATPPGRIEGVDRVIPLASLPLLPLYDDVIAEFDFLAVLGDTVSTELRLEESAAVGGTVDIREEPGAFTLTDLCEEGGLRLFDGDGIVRLDQNHPNPFNSETTIRYEVIERAPLQLRIRDLRGRVVRTLYEGMAQPGRYALRFDAAELPSGVYVCELRSGTLLRRRMISLLK
jgi:hypothetical protein